MQPDKPRVIIACKVAQSLIEPYLVQAPIPATFMEYGLHRAPALMLAALQERVDQIANPSVVILGYGLCGNGLVGLKARVHTLIVPRVHDCITIFLGSHQRYMEDFSSEPGTYYLTKGWLESGSHPLKEYHALVEKYDREAAEWIIDAQYQNYKRLVLVAPTRAELELCRDQASEVAEFCAARWGFRYEERIGSDKFVKELVTSAPSLRKSNDDFLVVPPGGEIKQEMFWREQTMEKG
jgi:hypothetical protein